jgi:hypothetical protein
VTVQQTTQCWECEAPTAGLATVALRIGARQRASVALCQGCFDKCYLPLASAIDVGRGELVIVPAS